MDDYSTRDNKGHGDKSPLFRKENDRKKKGDEKSDTESVDNESILNIRLPRRPDLSDSKVVKRIWINQKRGGLPKRWKLNAGRRLNLNEPIIPLRTTKASFLREQHVEVKKAHKFNSEARMIGSTRKVPDYKPVYFKQNLTSQFRYKFVRNNPVVSQYYIDYFEKFEKPPFVLTAANTGKRRRN